MGRGDADADDAGLSSTTTTFTFPWHLANLVYGIFDVAGTPSVEAFGDRRLVETARDVQYFGDCYCADIALRRESSDVSPLRGDLRGMPPAVFTAGKVSIRTRIRLESTLN